MLERFFSDLNVIHESDSAIVYEGVRQSDGLPVIIKTCKQPEQAARLKKVYELLRNKDIGGISNVIDLLYDESAAYLLFRNTGGVVLNQYLEGRALDGARFVQIARNAAKSLANVHASGILHRDVKPSNMLVHPETLDVYFIDFGLSVLTDEEGRAESEEGVVGTAEYISPEQTGRMTDRIDARSDLYSLGVSFYQMATGALPFTGNTQTDILHGHLALLPAPPAELADISESLSDIIMKLLEKSPDKRYQSAKSLEYDLNLCLEPVLRGQRVKPFTLGEKDILLNFGLEHKLYGKEREMLLFSQLFDTIPGNRGELVIVNGRAHTGKSQLLSAFAAYAREKNGFVVTGFFEEARRDDSFYALNEGFDRFFDYLAAHQYSLARLKEMLMKQLGASGQALVGMLPCMARIVGAQPPLVHIGFVEHQRRMRQVFNVLIQALAKPAFPLVIILDNAQWADDYTLSFILSALEEAETKNCIFILSVSELYGPNETLQAFYEKLADASFNVRRMTVHDLTLSDVRALVSDALSNPPGDIKELADYIFETSGGRPQEITFVLRRLYDGRLIRYDKGAGNWVWDMDGIRSADLTMDIEKSQLATLAGLSPDVRRMAVALAHVGMEFTYEDVRLCWADSASEKDFFARAKHLVRQRILEYDTDGETFTFAKNSMFRHCYNMAPYDTAAELHYTNGKNILAYCGGDEAKLAEHCIRAADHLNLSRGLIADENEQLQWARINYLAGNQAMEMSSALHALKYYKKAMSILGDMPFKRDYRLAFDVSLCCSDCHFALGNAAEWDAVFDAMLAGCNNEQDRYMIVNKRMEQFVSADRLAEAAACGQEYLEDTGFAMPGGKDKKKIFNGIYGKFRQNLETRDVDTFPDMPPIQDEKLRRQAAVYALTASAMFGAGDTMGESVIYDVINLAYAHGNFPHLETVLLFAAVRRAAGGEVKRAETLINVCFAYARKHNLKTAQLHFYNGLYIAHWSAPLAQSLDIYKEAKRVAMEEGNFALASRCDAILLDTMIVMGNDLSKIASETEAAVLFAKKEENAESLAIYSGAHTQYVRCLTGRTNGPDTFDGKDFSEAEFMRSFKDNPRVLAYYYALKFQALVIHRRYEQALQVYENLTPHESALGSSVLAVQCAVFAGIVNLQLAQRLPGRAEAFKNAAQRLMDKAVVWSRQCKANFRHKMLMLQGELDRLEGRYGELFSLLAEFNELVGAGGFKLDAAILEEFVLDYWIDENVLVYIQYHRGRIAKAYQAMGAKVKAWEHIQPESPHQGSLSTAPSSHSTAVSNTTTASETKRMDALLVLDVVSGLNAGLNLKETCGRLLVALEKLCGCDKGFVVTLSENGPILQAAHYAAAVYGNVTDAMLPAGLQDLPPEQIPAAVIGNVLAKGAVIVCNTRADGYMFYLDPYISLNEPECFACAPIMTPDKLVGAVYLENRNLPGVFTPERAELSKTVLAQAALILQNTIYFNEISAYTKTVEERLKEHIGSLNALIAGIAHEINSPVGVCVTVISKLKDLTLDVYGRFKTATLSKNFLNDYLEESEKGLGIAMANIARAAGLIQNFKKVSVNQSTDVFETLNLKETLSNIIDYIRPLVKKKVGKIELSGPDSFKTVTCSGALTQIFTNLIMNAAIHGFEGMDKDDCVITLRFHQEADAIVLVFADNGKGMLPEQLEKLFRPFYTTKRSQGGSGLGAHIIMTQVTQTLHGSIECASTLGKGTAFTIKLPLSKTE